MRILRRLATVILSVALLIPCIAEANVVRPALDIQLFTGDSGAVLTTSTPVPTFNIDATAFAIVTDTIGGSINIPNQAFTLSAALSADTNLFTGTFNVAGGLLSGTFDNMVISVSSGSGSIDFAADLTYDQGSLKGNLTGGRLEGIGDANNLAAKLGPVTVVPVPAAVWLFGTGLIGLVGVARRKT